MAPKFTCPSCLVETPSRVLETRGARRRRECLECGTTFATIEAVAARFVVPRHRAAVPQAPLPFAVLREKSH